MRTMKAACICMTKERNNSNYLCSVKNAEKFVSKKGQVTSTSAVEYHEWGCTFKRLCKGDITDKVHPSDPHHKG